jgi:hypothetical protein
MTPNFQEKNLMKKMMLATLALVMLFSLASTPAFAAATLYDFTFRNTVGTAYCDGLFVYLYKGSSPFGTGGKTLVDGFHWNDNCGGGQTNVNGFKAGIAAPYQYNGIGANLIISDPLLGDGLGGGTGIVWLVNPVYGTWTLWESGGGAGEFVLNYGTFVNLTHADKKGSVPATKRQ